MDEVELSELVLIFVLVLSLFLVNVWFGLLMVVLFGYVSSKYIN